MNDRVRGAAHVSVMWVIMLFVLLLAAGGAIWVVSSKSSELEASLSRVRVDAANNLQTAQEALGQLGELSTAVGFRDEATSGSPSSVSTVTDTVTSIRDRFSFVGADAVTLQVVVDRLAGRIDELDRLLVAANQQRDAEVQSRETQQQSHTGQLQQKDDEIVQLEDSSRTERDRAQSQEDADRSRIEDLSQQVSDAQAQKRASEEAADAEKEQLMDEVQVRDNALAEARSKLEVLKYPDTPDGAVVEVSTATSICFIDRGRGDLLRRGTRFKVFRHGKAGEMIPTGRIEVRQVHDNRAECGILSMTDELNPIAPGDFIAAPNYDPNQEREFVLEGRFPTGFSKAMVADRLRSLGARVADTVSPRTDFLILGDSEQEGLEMDEEASADPRETENFRMAQLYKVQVLPVREILEFVRFD